MDEDPKETETLLGSTEEQDTEAADHDSLEPPYGGAKPKVRPNVDETKKRRRVLRKAHSISHSPFSDSKAGNLVTMGSKSAEEPLEEQALLEPEQKSPDTRSKSKEKKRTIQKSNDSPRGGACSEFFGVRSYLHTFYDTVAVGNPNLYDDFGDPEYRYLIVPQKKRRMALFWKVTFWMGINLLIFGLILILIGYLVPRHGVIVGMEADMEIIDKSAILFNANLDLCKIVGLVVFCVGGTILVAVLLFPSLMNQYCEEELGTPTEPFKMATGPPDPPQSPTEKKIPATEELSSVQPRREQEETNLVMTNSGLCKVP